MNSSYLESPIFLVGAERSGTTVLRLMLDHHPEISWHKGLEYAVDVMPEHGGWPDLRKYYNWLDTHRIFQSSGLTIDKDLDYPTLINDFLVQHRDRAKKSIVGATVHFHFDRLLRIWPKARFIHIVRDGRDVARSNMDMGWAGNVWTGLEKWIEAEDLWGKLQRTIAAERYIDIRFETLIHQPKQELSRLCEFVGVAYHPAMMEYVKETAYDTPDPKYIDQWRRTLTNWQIQLIESRIASMLIDRDYELSDLPRINVGSLLQFYLQVNSWWKCTQFRINRNGVLLVIADYLSRKLGLIQWQKRVRLQLNAVETAYLK